MSHNRLAAETSPYLLQHAHNPVHWWAWGPEALAAAKAANKPILLSVGYSACHWCHVMAHESFEDEGIAGLMNDLFINIKVDREERPDLDALYQNALGLIGQHGGWPLTMFLTPDAEPFWGGTYFPAQARYGRAAFPDVLEGISHSFHKDPDKIGHNVARIRESLEQMARSPGPLSLDMEVVDLGAAQCLRLIDFEDGGTVGAPKFPQPGLFRFLWHSYLRTGNSSLKDAVTVTLDHICQGGIYDHLGGGFMRYSTDETWLVPHFEKMLYDNAQLVSLLTKVWKQTGSPLYRARIFETVGWLLRDMMAEGGAFAAALDADSEGEEGLFYTWTSEELSALLDIETATRFGHLYGVQAHGNWEGRNILHRNHPRGGGDDHDLAEAKMVLLAERDKRIWPGRDDKVLADWNAMMITALAEAALTFDRPDWLAAAEHAFQVITTRMVRPDGRPAHSLCRGRAETNAVLDDYAWAIFAALTLYETTTGPEYLDQAIAWAEQVHAHHWDGQGGGYFLSADDATDVVIRTKPAFDSAVPSGNGVMAEVLARLWLVTGEERWRERAQAVIDAFGAAMPEQIPHMTSLLDAFAILAEPLQVVIVGPLDDPGGLALLRAFAATSLPPASLLRVQDGNALPVGHPAHGKSLVDGCAAAYICRGSTCRAPVTDSDRLMAQLCEK
ncbi:Thymidylate kinase [Paramagnetospirillum magnetotacticum MS-1]|uniref:Thymidylate kinase n=1 Tax=Paramagnetospirillum magnetotacticum MS-1 TaxID=272627 RepID=A0A0C2UYI5_PARME|nr:thioredoxin domain-containing protein [Paramagnetospirillum magnetotacticum]KIL97871.1 Thymidylate kinase [Paramagnetospirillum magnetotacticum MS-1]